MYIKIVLKQTPEELEGIQISEQRSEIICPKKQNPGVLAPKLIFFLLQQLLILQPNMCNCLSSLGKYRFANDDFFSPHVLFSPQLSQFTFSFKHIISTTHFPHTKTKETLFLRTLWEEKKKVVVNTVKQTQLWAAGVNIFNRNLTSYLMHRN